MFGREDALTTALSIVQAGSSLDIVGSRGSGRSAFLRALHNRLLNADWHVLTVRGIASLRQHPFAAMHLAGIGDAAESRLTPTLAATFESLKSATSRPRSVLILDDWDDLDESSWGLAEAARRTTGLPLILSRLKGRTARQTPSGLPASAMDPTFVLEIGPLRFEDMESALVEHLGESIEPATMSRIFAKSGGNIGLGLSLVDAAVREGRLTRGGQGWESVKDLWSPALRGLLEAQLEELPQEARDALEVIALVGLTDVETVRKLVDWSTVEQLEARSLIRLVPATERQLVTVVPPLLVEFFRHEPLATRRIRLSELITQKLESSRVPELVLQEGSAHEWQGDDALFVRLLQERARALRIVAEAEWRETNAAGAAVTYVTALLQIPGARDSVAEVFNQTDPTRDDPLGRARFAVIHAQWRAFVLDDLDGALNDLKTEARFLGPYGRMLDASAVVLEVLLRSVPSDLESRLVEDDDLPDAVREALWLAQMLVGIVEGRFQDARDAYTASLRQSPDAAPSMLSALNGLVLMGEGRLEEARQWSLRGLDEAKGLLDAPVAIAHAFVAGLCQVFAGDYASAESTLDTAFAVGSPSPLLLHMHLGLLAMGAVVAVRVDNLAVARRLDAELLALKAGDGPLPGQSRAWPLAQNLSRAGRLHEAAETFWNAAEAMWARGGKFTACLGFLAACEIEADAERLALTRTRIGLLEGSFLTPWLDYLEARDSDDIDGLGRAAESLAATGRLGLASLAYAQAEELAQRNGDDTRRRHWTQQRREFTEKTGATQLDSLRFFRVAAPFTAREAEIAGFVADGLSNPDIARRLVLSVRTVESHMHRIIRKAGVTNRSELIEYVRARPESRLPART